ncbi:MAG: MaoC family dehydratase N-terminal domain-containing protein [Dermatophilaceae bacterium]
MPVSTSFSGRVYPPSPPWSVGRESVREFARAVGARSPLHHDVEAARAAGYADLVAPPTYAVVIAQRCETTYVTDPDSGIDFSRVVHAEEQFAYERPIVAGEEVVGTLHVERVREVGGHAIVTTRVELVGAPEGREPRRIGSVTSTLVVRGEDV